MRDYLCCAESGREDIVAVQKQLLKESTIIHTHNHVCGPWEDLFIRQTCAVSTNPEEDFKKMYIGQIRTRFCPIAAARMLKEGRELNDTKNAGMMRLDAPRWGAEDGTVGKVGLR